MPGYAGRRSLYPRLQRADTVALLGQVMMSLGMCVSADEEAPDYLRPSQAEREKAERDQ